MPAFTFKHAPWLTSWAELNAAATLLRAKLQYHTWSNPRFNTIPSKCPPKPPSAAQREDATEAIHKLRVQAETWSIEKPLGKWWMSTGLVCLCVHTAPMKDEQVWYPHSFGIPQHPFIIVMQRRMQSQQGLGKTSAYLSLQWKADRYFSRAPGGSREKN